MGLEYSRQMKASRILIQTELGPKFKSALMRLVPDACCYLDSADAPLDEIDVVIAWRLPQELLHALPGLKWIQSTGAGVDQFLSASGLPSHVLITRVGINSGHVPGMAEYALAIIVAVSRRLYEFAEAQRLALWKPSAPLLLRTLSVGVIGLGRIGNSVAMLLRRTGIAVRGLRRNAQEGSIDGIPVYGHEQLSQFLEDLDFVVLTVPLTQASSRMLAMPQFERMKPTTWIINMSRGGVIDDGDLILALDKGILGGAALDVFQREPLPRDHPFWSHPHVIVTPHISGEIVVAEAAAEFAENVRRFRSGEPLQFLVSREKGY